MSGNWRGFIVTPDDAHALPSMREAAIRVPARYYHEPDPDLEDFCPACTPEWHGAGWVHERSCIARRSAREPG